MLGFSQACENNKQPIVDVLSSVFASHQHVLEIGSGTAQHAVYFAQHLSHLTWQPSDVQQNLAMINARLELEASKLNNLLPPIEFDLSHLADRSLHALQGVDAIFSANTLHIVSWPLVKQCLMWVGDFLPRGGRAVFYGPFNYNGHFSSASNERFNIYLQQRDSRSAIRDFEKIVECAAQAQLSLLDDISMPANNQLLVFEKRLVD